MAEEKKNGQGAKRHRHLRSPSTDSRERLQKHPRAEDEKVQENVADAMTSFGQKPSTSRLFIDDVDEVDWDRVETVHEVNVRLGLATDKTEDRVQPIALKKHALTRKEIALIGVTDCLGSTYTIDEKQERELGSGGFGAVWKAKDSGNRVMAVKFQIKATPTTDKKLQLKVGDRWTMREFMKRSEGIPDWPNKVPILNPADAQESQLEAFKHEAYWSMVASNGGYGPRVYDIFVCPRSDDLLFGILVMELFSMSLERYLELVDLYADTNTQAKLEADVRKRLQPVYEAMVRDLDHGDLAARNVLVKLDRDKLTIEELESQLKARREPVLDLLQLAKDRGLVISDYGEARDRKYGKFAGTPRPFAELWSNLIEAGESSSSSLSPSTDTKETKKLETKKRVGEWLGHRGPGYFPLQSIDDIPTLPAGNWLIFLDPKTNDSIAFFARANRLYDVYLRVPPAELETARALVFDIAQALHISVFLH